MTSDKEAVYRRLEAEMLAPADYQDIPVQARFDLMVPILESRLLSTSVIRDDARVVTGERTYIRYGVLQRLLEAAEILYDTQPDMQLDVGYGYRSLQVQTTRFNAVRDSLRGQYSGQALDYAAHRAVAMPELAGHPAGAAVDVQIRSAGQPLDFGTNMWEFVKNSYAASPFVSAEAQYNRQLLRRVMTEAGFAPYLGEWWHFFYGDKEWARYYHRPTAYYDQIDFSIVPRTMYNEGQ